MKYLILVILLFGCSIERPYTICYKKDKIIWEGYSNSHQLDYGYWRLSDNRIIQGRCITYISGKPQWNYR